MKSILAIAGGAALGANLRALIVFLGKRLAFTDKFPVDILLCNGLGSFIAGFLFIYLQHKDMDENLILFISMGFLGSLTTFSTFAIDNLKLMQKSYLIFTSNIFLNVLLTLIAAQLGGWICRKWITSSV